jgi:predicted amidohydrolase YtcJ
VNSREAYRNSKTADGRLHSRVNFTDEEARAIVEEAHRLGKKVAAHAVGSDGIASALRAGVDAIEHGDGLTDVPHGRNGPERSVLGADVQGLQGTLSLTFEEGTSA